MKKLACLFVLVGFSVCFAQLQTALESIGVRNVYVADTSHGLAVFGDFSDSLTYLEAKDQIIEMLLNQRDLITPGVYYSVSLTINSGVTSRANLWLRIFQDGEVSITKTPYKQNTAGLAGPTRKNGCISSSSENGANVTCYQDGLVEHSSYCVWEGGEIICKTNE